MFELEKGEHLIQFSVESRLEPDIIANYFDTQDQSLREDDGIDSLAEVAIHRITFRGAINGGAYECK